MQISISKTEKEICKDFLIRNKRLLDQYNISIVSGKFTTIKFDSYTFIKNNKLQYGGYSFRCNGYRTSKCNYFIRITDETVDFNKPNTDDNIEEQRGHNHLSKHAICNPDSIDILTEERKVEVKNIFEKNNLNRPSLQQIYNIVNGSLTWYN